MSIKLLIADEQEIARLGLQGFLAGTEIDVVGEANGVREAVAMADSCRPDVAILAMRMQGQNTLELLGSLEESLPEIPVIITIDQDHPVYLAQAYKAGAQGVFLKSQGPEELLEAIRVVATGKPAWTRADKRRVTGVSGTPQPDVDIDAPLTLREVEVLRAMTEGQTNDQIAQTLGVSYETVKEHVQHVLRKVGVGDRTQAAVWAVRSGLAATPVPRPSRPDDSQSPQ